MIQGNVRSFRYVQRLNKAHTEARRLLLATAFVSEELNKFFLGELLALVFGVTFGSIQVFFKRSAIPYPGLLGSLDDLSFGQLVPLIFILLPILAAGEVYFGKS